MMQRGTSLLEVILALLIIAIITVTAVRYLFSYAQSERIAMLERSVGQLMQSLDDYYYNNCNNPNVVNVNLAVLQQQGYAPPNIINPWGTLEVQIVNTTNNNSQPFYQLKVIAELTIQPEQYAGVLASFIRADLNADQGQGTTITWSRLPAYTTDDLSSQMWLILQRPGMVYAAVPGRALTAVDTGRNGRMWISDADLQAVSQILNDPTINTQYPNLPGKVYPACPN